MRAPWSVSGRGMGGHIRRSFLRQVFSPRSARARTGEAHYSAPPPVALCSDRVYDYGGRLVTGKEALMVKRSMLVTILALTVLAFVVPSTGEARRYGWRGGWGWYGGGAFAGGVVVGAVVARPWYYAPPPVYVYPRPVYVYPPAYAYSPGVVYTPPADTVYVPNQAYAYPESETVSGQLPAYAPWRGGSPSSGEWVRVPGQYVGSTWVPAHRVWTPDNP